MMSESAGVFRRLMPGERGILDRLLEVEFPGRDEIRRQLKDCVVRTIDEDGSLEINVVSDVAAPVTKRIPIEAEVMDEDGVTVHFLLHVVQGIVRELEVYKDDSSRLIKELNPSDLHVVKLD